MPNLSYGFKPNGLFSSINCISIYDCHHEGITEEALTSITTENEGEVFNFSKRAIREIKENNSFVDTSHSFFSEVHHCDNELIAQCSKNITTANQEIIKLIKIKTKKSAKRARQMLGRALHALQDFYSHSNWVDLGNTSISTELVKGNIVTLKADEETCMSDLTTLTKFGLSDVTTGYYPNGETPTEIGKIKCSHGDGDGEHDPGINKDATTRLNHNEARSLAIKATTQYVLSILMDSRIKLDLEALRKFMMVGGDMGFVVDTTSSMEDEIAGVKESITKITNDTKKTSFFDNFVLTTFGDPQGGKIAINTISKNKFLEEIGKIIVDGGEDCPELSMSGIQKALDNVSDSSQVFVYTDASAKDSILSKNVIALANKKQSSVIFILTGTCSPVDQAYIDIANKTGGQILLIDQNEVKNLDVLIAPIIKGSRQLILNIEDNFISPKDKEYSLPVDSSIDILTISSVINSSMTVEIKKPDGTVVDGTEVGVRIEYLSSGAIFQIINPTPGIWSIHSKGSGEISLSIFGNSSIELTDVVFLKKAGRPSHEGLFPIDGLPTEDGSIVMFKGIMSQAELMNSVINYEFRDEKGNLLSTIPVVMSSTVQRTAKQHYARTNVLPNEPFRIYVSGTDIEENQILRAFPTVFKKQFVSISAEVPMLLVEGGEILEMPFTIKNLAELGDYTITASVSDGSTALLDTNKITLAKGESDKIKVTLKIPKMETEGEINLTVIAKNVINSDISNSSVVEFSVGRTTFGDFNNDDCVDRSDYDILMDDIRNGNPNDLSYDLNKDAFIDRTDARILVGLFDNPRGLPCK